MNTCIPLSAHGRSTRSTFLFYAVLALLFMMVQTGRSQATGMEYLHTYITTREGLSHNYVSAIISDSLNNKWIATENGITRYNGYDFDYIKPSLGFEDLRNENIETLYLDSRGRVWVGTKSGGVSLIDPKTNQIQCFNKLLGLQEGEENFRITTITEDARGFVWVGTWDQGVYVIDPAADQLRNHYPHLNPVYKIISARDGEVWYVVDNEVYQFPAGRETALVHTLEIGLSDLVFDRVRDKVWISSNGSSSKLFFYDYKTGAIGQLETQVISHYFKALSLDYQNRLWIGTWGYGLYRSDEPGESPFEKIAFEPIASDRVKNNYSNVLQVHHDTIQQVWLATANAGIVKLTPNNGFVNLSNLVAEEALANDFNIGAIYRDSVHLYIGTLKKGLFRLDPDLNSTRVSPYTDVKINCLYPYQNKLMVGTNEGFGIYDRSTGTTLYPGREFRKVTAFHVDPNGRLYIGTQQRGLFSVPLDRIDEPSAYRVYSDGEEQPYKMNNNRITDIVQDSEGRIWVGTFNGIHLLNASTGGMVNPSNLLDTSPPSVIINDLETTPDGLWAATPSGLIGLRFDAGRKKLSIRCQLSRKEGLENDFISSITHDGQGFLWISSNREIIRYNTRNLSYLAYGPEEGVNANSFNNRSVYNSPEHGIFFGANDNLTGFDPIRLTFESQLPRVIFTGLTVDNRQIRYQPEEQVVDAPINYAELIELTHLNDFLALRFSTNDFLGKRNVKYRYRLLGLKEEWIELQQKNEINFAGLPAGTYTLQVSATRDNLRWGPAASLDIRVKGSPWLSSWAWASYMLIALGIAYVVLRFKGRQRRLQLELELTQIEKEKELAIGEAKLSFFTSISHEFRTPLTLMAGPIKELSAMEIQDEFIRKKVYTVEKHTDKLLQLVNQLLDFRKAEKGALKLNASEGNFVRFSREVYLYLREYAQERKIDYRFECQEKQIRFPFDRNKMEIVLCNLIFNAIKYCKPGDSVILRLSQKGNACLISVKDTGIGIDPEMTDKIFDRFYQIRSSNTSKMVGSGIGLAFSKKIVELHHGEITVESVKNKGSEFFIRIQMDPELYADCIDDSFRNTDDITGYYPYRSEQMSSTEARESPGKSKLLLIDDNSDILNYLEEILSKDYKLYLATGADQGLEIARKEIPDLIVSDCMMPGMDGFTLCKELKGYVDTSHIPVILLTARTSTVHQIEGLQTGADDYLTKPFNPAVIRTRIANILQNREKLRLHYANKVRFEPHGITEDERADPENDFINKAMELVEAHMQDSEFGIENLIDAFNMSQSTLYRKIKSLTGLSLSAFIRSVRIKRAAHLILTTDLNMNQVAYEVGFNDYKYFNSCFKKQFQCLPTQYRGQYQEK